MAEFFFGKQIKLNQKGEFSWPKGKKTLFPFPPPPPPPHTIPYLQQHVDVDLFNLEGEGIVNWTNDLTPHNVTCHYGWYFVKCR